MDYFTDPDTLAGQLGGRPFCTFLDISQQPAISVAKRVRDAFHNKPAFGQATLNANPLREAVEFYMLEHAVGAIRQRLAPDEALGPFRPILETYNRRGMQMAARAFAYLLLICARESRHQADKAEKAESFASQIGWTKGKVESYFALMQDHPGVDTVTGKIEMAALNAHPDGGNATLGEIVRLARLSFYYGKYSPSYGGPKWGVISDVLLSFVEGKTTAAMMLDTVWTLAHNTAPIFNKQVLYDNPSASTLLEILDLQRAGLIPTLVLHPHTAKKAANMGYDWIQPLAKTCQDLLGKDFSATDHIDWAYVQKMGAVGQHSGKIANSGSGKGSVSSGAGGITVVMNVPKVDPNLILAIPGLALKKEAR